MLISRAAFLKLLGLGQQVVFAADICREGEEKCPLGHCQKPRYIALSKGALLDNPALEHEVVTYNPMGNTLNEGNVVCMECATTTVYERINQHVCSTCGIVYVLKRDTNNAIQY